jgi:tRNA U55 pseudouridine synthase TruB
VHDVGQDLGCGAFLDDLRRTAIGAFTVEEAWNLADIMEHATDSPREMKGYDEGQKGN